MAECPVCGMDVDESTALTANWEGETYYFCSRACRDSFLADEVYEEDYDEEYEEDLEEKLEEEPLDEEFYDEEEEE